MIWRLIEVYKISPESESVLSNFPSGIQASVKNNDFKIQMFRRHRELEVNPMTIFSKVAMATLLLLLISFIPLRAHAEVDWEISSAIQLGETPIDVALAQDGGLTYILTDQAKVLIYSAAGKLTGTIPVDPSVTDIAISVKGEKLYLINSQRKTLKTVAIDFIVDFDISDSPFLGPAGAEIIVAVFSDFQ